MDDAEICIPRILAIFQCHTHKQQIDILRKAADSAGVVVAAAAKEKRLLTCTLVFNVRKASPE